MSTTLTQANKQWTTRPADERFPHLLDLHNACGWRRRESTDCEIPLDAVKLTVNGHITIETMHGLHLTHWAAGQLCQRLGVPRDLLLKLDPATATAVVNDRLPKALDEGDLQRRQRVLLQGNKLRAFHGAVYDRVWDAQVTRTLVQSLPSGWRNPVAYAQGKFGAPLEPSGLYAGDRDMFGFFIDGGDWREDQPNAGSFSVDGEQFNRGIFVWNSEVGAKTLGFMTFVFDVVCGNHYVWGARNVEKYRSQHRGRGATRILDTLRWYLQDASNSNGPPEGFAEAVRAAKSEIVVPVRGATNTAKVETLDDAFKAFKGSFTQGQIVLALDAMLAEETNVTGTRYDWLAGFTAVARSMENADERNSLEVQASKTLLTPVK